jgi:AcrR family transcriptional regulator
MGMNKRKVSARHAPLTGDQAPRARVLEGAFAAFREHGFAGASTLEIATRAQVSKRDLYSLFDNKHAILIACIKERTHRMRQPLDAAVALPPTRKALAGVLVEFGISVLRIVCHPDVLAVHRLAIAESDRAREIGRILDTNGREANHAALRALLAKAQAQDIIGAGDVAAMATHYFAVLWGDLLVRLLLRVREPPTIEEIKTRASNATQALLTFRAPAEGVALKSKRRPSL